MNYNDAIIKIIKENGLEILNQRFITRSILSDYVKDNYQDKKLIDALYYIYEQYDIVQIFEQHGLKNGRIELKEKYNTVKEKCTINEYKNAINPISKYMFPTEFQETNQPKEMQAPTVVVTKNKDTTELKKIKLINQIPQPVKNPPKPQTKNIKIEIGNYPLQIKRNNKNEIEIYNGNLLIKTKNIPLTNNTLHLDLKNIDCKNKITIYIPHKNYEQLTINNDSLNSNINTTIDISLYNTNLSPNEYYFKNVLINGYYKTLNYQGLCNELIINSKADYSQIFVESKLNRLFINTLKGEVHFNTSPRLKKDINIFIRANIAKIKGTFGKNKLKKLLRFSVLSKFPIVINRSYKLNFHKINIDIKTTKGSLSLS